ncbi:hypothetical protein [Streptomyces sp. NPDC005012]|uniref:hypothetical protein n=1 Tax=unclassified Streptomyces TaxID=2593676 RepID=UPI0033ACB8AF
MLTTSRVMWFVIALLFTTPAMLLMFKDGELTAQTWISGLGFAVAVSVIAATAFGKGAK